MALAEMQKRVVRVLRGSPSLEGAVHDLQTYLVHSHGLDLAPEGGLAPSRDDRDPIGQRTRSEDAGLHPASHAHSLVVAAL